MSDTRVFESAESRRRFLIHAAVAVLVLALVAVLVRRYVPTLTSARELRATIHGFGALGPVVLVALQAVQVVVAPVPGQVLAVVAGYLYGAWWGTLYNMLGVTIGSTVAFWLSRRYGRPYVERVVHDDALATFDAVDDDYVRVALFVFFLLPGLPDDALCFVGGLTRLPLRQLVAIAVLGRAPVFFLVNVVGAFFEAGRVGAGVLLAALVTGVSVVAYRYRDALLGLFDER
ncbi:TVP38/TMEM64 family protein [Halosimplex salinum]|uniref:TVP38/TMEM64 family protein n=1 Tax=Halosimplex salinum TaxID=1710538 RepID=UPI0019D12A8E|nr:VTT domain-containing protein [Halosimplex salinum]